MTKSKSKSGNKTMPPTREEFRQTRSPRSSRTPALGTRVARPSRAPSIPAWALHAQKLVEAAERALASPNPDPRVVAGLERAWAAWALGERDPDVVRRVAHLIDRAYVAMHAATRKQPEEAMQGAARILYSGLPRVVRDETDYARIVTLVRSLEKESELWPAVVRATAELLGWQDEGMQHAGHLIRIAMASGTERL